MGSESLKLENRVPGALLLALLVPAACGDQAPAVSTRPKAPTAVVVEVVAPELVAPRLRVAGLVEARARIELAFRVEGFVERFHVDEGERVEAGALLAELDAADLERDARVARAVLARAAAHAADAERNFARQEELFARRSTSQQGLDSARSARDMARADQREARARLESAEDRLAKAVLRAPVAGVIEERLLDAHERATALAPVLVLTQLDTVKVRAAVADAQLARLRVGTPATVRTPLWPERRFDGRVALIGVAADPATRTVPFEVELPNPDGVLRPELVVDVDLPLGAPEPKTLVPLGAVLRDADTRPFCFVTVGVGRAQHAERRSVQLGGVHGERVAVVSGLTAGERLIVRGQHFVRDGDPVRPVED